MPKKEVAELAKSLGNQKGICLRYVTLREITVDPEKLVSKIEWSFLPKTYLEAKAVLESLVSAKLAKKVGKRGFASTKLGGEVVAYANKNGMWNGPRFRPDHRRYK